MYGQELSRAVARALVRDLRVEEGLTRDRKEYAGFGLLSDLDTMPRPRGTERRAAWTNRPAYGLGQLIGEVFRLPFKCSSASHSPSR